MTGFRYRPLPEIGFFRTSMFIFQVESFIKPFRRLFLSPITVAKLKQSSSKEPDYRQRPISGRRVFFVTKTNKY